MRRPAGQRHRDGTDEQRRPRRAARDLGSPDRAGRREDQPGELAAAAHAACYAMALALRLGEHKAVPERLAITATVTLDEAGGVPIIVSSHLDVTATVPGLDAEGLGARAVTSGTAIALALPRPAETALTAVLVLATAVRQGARNATLLHAAIAALSLALLTLGTVVAT